MGRRHDEGHGKKIRRWPGYLAAFLVLLLFAALGTLPWVAKLGRAPSWVVVNQHSHAIQALPVPALPRLLPTLDSARGPRASLPPAGRPSEADVVKREDLRIRTALRDGTKIVIPTVAQIGSGAPTLILPARPKPYTARELAAAHALTPLPRNEGQLLVDNVVVSGGASLTLGGAAMTVLRLTSTPSQFVSIVVSNGSLKLFGASKNVPTTITSWDPERQQAASDSGRGRAYIRAIASRMTLKYVNAASLGFWSGRTGGVAWTGSSSVSSTGGAADSTFRSNAYGAYLSNTTAVNFTKDVFELNEADGLRLHRGVADTTVNTSVSARNGGNGFVVDRATHGDTLDNVMSVNNEGDGFLFNGRALVRGLSPSGASATQSQGVTLVHSEATLNGSYGVLVAGGQSPVLQSNTICVSGKAVGIALRDAATGVQILGNNVNCGGSVGLEVGAGVIRTIVQFNTFGHAHIGILIRSAPGVRLVGNHVDSNSVFGLSIRGPSPDVEGSDNVVTGRGIRSLDVQQGAPKPLITQTDVSNFTHEARVSTIDYFRFHPILLVWVGIGVLALFASLNARLRRHRPRKLYAQSNPELIPFALAQAPSRQATTAWYMSATSYGSQDHGSAASAAAFAWAPAIPAASSEWPALSYRHALGQAVSEAPAGSAQAPAHVENGKQRRLGELRLRLIPKRRRPVVAGATASESLPTAPRATAEAAGRVV